MLATHCNWADKKHRCYWITGEIALSGPVSSTDILELQAPRGECVKDKVEPQEAPGSLDPLVHPVKQVKLVQNRTNMAFLT